MTTDDLLDQADRIHDDDPNRAGAVLRSLDATSLAADRLPLLAFLILHVLGEKLGCWEEAADRLAQISRSRRDAPLAVVAHAAAAAQLAGRADDPALEALAAAGGSRAAQTLTALAVLGWRPPGDVAAMAAELGRLADASAAIDPAGPLDQRLAAGFNNATSRLLDLAPAPVDASVRDALLAGSAAALRFWTSAGTWVNHERALYLCALVHNRLGDAAAARADCETALELIRTHGDEPVDAAFLALQLAGALSRLGDTAAARRHLDDARRAAAQWDDPGLKSWFGAEHDRLFAPGEMPQ
jgi:tetratricopeptide (TPR) repeat protein